MVSERFRMTSDLATPGRNACLAQVMEQVGAAFVERSFGAHERWAHNTLFFAELASQQV